MGQASTNKELRFSLACCLGLVASLFAANVASTESSAKPWKAALTISGGISLGAYEAGLNWALVKILKDLKNGPLNVAGISAKPELVAVTGASAGGINALATVIHWCARRGLDDTLEDNLFRKFWMPVGFSNMLPDQPEGNAYDKDDGLLSRVPFREPIGKLECILGTGRDQIGANDDCKPVTFEQSCNVGLGFSLTVEKPVNLRVAGVKVPAQSMKLPIQVTAPNGQLMFKPESALLKKGTSGKMPPLNRIALPASTDGTIAVKSMTEVVLATSAFPIAFGRKTLTYCYFRDFITERRKEYTRSLDECPENMVLRTHDFLDGGVFDNIPLDLAIALAGVHSGESAREEAKNIHYIYLDPDRRRTAGRTWTGEPEQEEQKIPEKAYGLLQQTGFISGAVRSGRTYELYNTLVLNEGALKGNRLILSDRFHPITGTMLSAFGAFLDPKFRELDYLIGVYDAIVDIAASLCDISKCSTLKDLVITLSNHLKFANHHNADNRLVFSLLFCGEFPDDDSCRPTTQVDEKRLPLASLFVDLNLAASQKTPANCETNKKVKLENREPEIRKEPTFCELAEQLNKTSLWSGADRLLLDSMKSPKRWYEPLALRVTRRLYALERQTRAVAKKWDKEVEKSNELESIADVALPVGAMNYLAHGFFASPQESVRASDTPIDTQGRWGSMFKMLPYEVGLDTRHGGVYFSWSPKWRNSELSLPLGLQFSLPENTDWELKVTPIALPASEEQISYYTSVEVGPRFHFDWLPFPLSSVGTGIGFQHDWQNNYEGGDGWNNNLNIGMFGDKLRLTTVFRHDYGGKSWALLFGVTDFQGLIDWVSKK